MKKIKDLLYILATLFVAECIMLIGQYLVSRFVVF